ncbi:MAG: glycosyltransferase family 2 protein [Clostridia bacterium]|nr:glycosyltransferase family 2 protein [Clostridia bacterium]
MKVLIIIPAYNEELNIVKTVEDVKTNTKYDYVIINDGSKDKTKEICEKNHFNLVSLPINYGLTSAVQVGMKYALRNNYEIAIQFDGDGQHQAKELSKLVKEIENGEDIAIGSRFVTESKPRSIRMLGSNLITGIIRLTTNKTIKDPTSGMRAYNQDTIEELVSNSGLSPEPDTLVYMLKNKKKIKEVQVEMKEREFGESYLKPLKAMKYMISMFCSILFIRSFTKKK